MKKTLSVLAIFFLFNIQGAIANDVMTNKELNTDRMGSDFSNFDLEEADPGQCQAECSANAACKAWTYVKPNTTQGPRPRCWLKNAVSQATHNTCCVSGRKVKMSTMQHNIDRGGSDFSNFDLEDADPRLCEAQCAGNAACQAWTYVKPNTIQGPRPRCWLKNAVPQATQNTCCVSGTK